MWFGMLKLLMLVEGGGWRERDVWEITVWHFHALLSWRFICHCRRCRRTRHTYAYYDGLGCLCVGVCDFHLRIVLRSAFQFSFLVISIFFSLHFSEATATKRREKDETINLMSLNRNHKTLGRVIIAFLPMVKLSRFACIARTWAKWFPTFVLVFVRFFFFVFFVWIAWARASCTFQRG